MQVMALKMLYSFDDCDLHDGPDTLVSLMSVIPIMILVKSDFRSFRDSLDDMSWIRIQ
jgi:hypothetical protein